MPSDRAINAYSLDEIAAEKLLALMDPQRSQPRDLYDLWYLQSEGLVELPVLDNAVAKLLNAPAVGPHAGLGRRLVTVPAAENATGG